MKQALNSLARGPLLVAAALMMALAVLWALVSQGHAQYLVPPPEQVGQSFLTSLKAHNFEAAHGQLSEDLQQQVSAADLREMNARLDAARTGIEQASGQTAQTQGQTGTATVKVKLKDGTEQTVDWPVRQENGLWSITSLAPLEALIGSQ
jgi:hypothetical protein